MLVAKLELWPHGDGTKAQPLGAIEIVNRETGSPAHGDYSARFVQAPTNHGRGPGRWRSGVVTGFPRRRLNAWDLLFRVLLDAVGHRSAAAKREGQRLTLAQVEGDTARTLDEIQNDTGPWADAAFPASTPASIVSHLREEFREFLDAETPAERIEELADIILLGLSFAHKNSRSLLEAVERKLAINKGRQWDPNPEAGGHQRHLSDDVPGQLLLEVGH